MRFESKEAGEAYQTHDLHLKVLDLLKNALDKSNGTPVMAMDYASSHNPYYTFYHEDVKRGFHSSNRPLRCTSSARQERFPRK